MDGESLKIEIFYSMSCGKCRVMETVVHTALEDLGLEADVKKFLNLNEAIERGARAQPAVWINDRLIMQGRVPLVSEMMDILRKEHELELSGSKDL